MSNCFSEATISSIVQAINTVLIAMVTGWVSVKMAHIRAHELEAAGKGNTPGGRRSSDLHMPVLTSIAEREAIATKLEENALQFHGTNEGETGISDDQSRK